MTTAALLALFACALAWPAPRLLAAARWPHRCPRAAIVLWQAIGLAGGVSALLAAAAFTVAPLSQGIPAAMADHAANLLAGDPLVGLGRMNLIGLAIAAALAARLFGVLAVSTAATLRERHRHRHLVDLAGHRHRDHLPDHAHGPAHGRSAGHGQPAESGKPAGVPNAGHASPAADPAGPVGDPAVTVGAPAGPAGGPAGPMGLTGGGAERPGDGCSLCLHRERSAARLRILDHPVAVAYCVPGGRHARVVVSEGLLRTLTPEELDAVLAHEEAHVAGRHDLVIQPFMAWERTFPFLRPAREATAAVSLLVEMLADDAAAQRTSGRTLARALARLGVTRAAVPAGTLGVTGMPPGTAPESLAALGVGGAGRLVATMTTFLGESSGAQRRSPVHTPVVTRISRLLDPPTVPIWLPGAAYLTAVAVFLAPVLLLLL
ncbi:peptidase M48 [Frankia sp. CcI49]|uniref:M56 family metallopeptidase n=1 Tax=unclassified Frankia TaxID=2632575 RepID=UPI0006CA15F7|nr:MULTISPECIES: M56 family metallopeptidase [unclassified Frankia]KPM53882.1 peptidase M48 [Frankia sp. R43]ONH52088.1 peptidase M48 [Frankia sp. CcI49]